MARPARDSVGPTDDQTQAPRMRAAPTKVLGPTCSCKATAANAVPHSGSVEYITCSVVAGTQEEGCEERYGGNRGTVRE